MRRERPHLHLQIGLIGLVVACRPEPQAPTVEPQPAPANRAEQPPPEARPTAPAGPSPNADPHQLVRGLAEEWCKAGGEAFRPPQPNPDEDWPPVLESCDEVEGHVVRQDEQDGVTASVLLLEAIALEERESLLIQGPGGSHRLELLHVLEDQSGEAGSYDRDWVLVELRDVIGDEGLEWIAILREEIGDNFEADRCYENGTVTSSLVVCRTQLGAEGCLFVPFSSLMHTRPRAADQLYDCTESADELEGPSVYGYVNTFVVEKDAVVFTPDPKAKIKEPEEPPYTGRVSLAELFADEPLEVE